MKEYGVVLIENKSLCKRISPSLATFLLAAVACISLKFNPLRSKYLFL